ncbi:MAG TPA: DUF1573 domain-containing protein [Bacteroidales bacterium]|nr:DUF1573 domain-containing protein [Bacteroidales bacterium]
MHFKFISLIGMLLIPSAILTAQEKPVISFSEKDYDFGTVRETDGLITHEFKFTNDGKVPLIINDVKSSCGCTVPSWPHEPVLPGKSATVKVTFNPENQSGAIGKTVKIISNASVQQVVLGLRGVVIPTEKVEDTYKFTVGDLRIQTIYAAFGEVFKGRNDTYELKVFNNSKTDAMSLSFKSVPAHLKITVTPEKLEPQQEGVIKIEYLSDQTPSWDYTVDRLNLLINGTELPNNRINVTASLKEDFSGYTADQMANAARAQFDEHEFDFGTIPEGKTVDHSFTIKNTGKSDLYIRKVSASCGCTAVQPAKTKIGPGDSTLIKAVFNTRATNGAQKKAITVITNDPKQSRAILWINAFVETQAGNKNSEQHE